MATPQSANLPEERELLENQLLPELDEMLDEYRVRILSNKYKEQFQQMAEGSREFADYSLPVIQTPEFGLVYPEYFVSKTDEAVEYGAAIEPHTKFIDIRDEPLREPLQTFAEEWKEETTISEISLGRADVSKVSFSPNERNVVYSTRR